MKMDVLVVHFNHVAVGHRRFQLVSRRIPVIAGNRQSHEIISKIVQSDYSDSYQNFAKSSLDGAEADEHSRSQRLFTHPGQHILQILALCRIFKQINGFQSSLLPLLPF